MSAPSILGGFSVVAIVPLILAAAIALLFWRTVVPRQLRGLQVAFETGPKRYEVHTITSTFGEARDLLQSRGMRFGVATYLFALTGALLLFFEYFITSQGWSDGYHAPNIALALILIVWPAIISSGSSLGAQIIWSWTCTITGSESDSIVCLRGIDSVLVLWCSNFVYDSGCKKCIIRP